MVIHAVMKAANIKNKNTCRTYLKLVILISTEFNFFALFNDKKV